MARRCLELDPSDPAIYLLLANIYDNAGFTDLGDKPLRLMRDRGLRKSSSQCWMEIRGKIYHFSTGESSYPQMDEIEEKLKLLETEFKNRGYPYIESQDKFHHLERLAVAFGLLSGSAMAPIRINKKLHICLDCHNFIMLVTQVVDREIIVRDGNEIRLFRKGHCSFRGQW
ncbi:hypothetical protein K1719_016096 [Acacia pycnantha]|nr:hypothetical protein K1719_016096 [Acacia pycnantha]